MIGNILRQRYQIVKELGAGGFGETYLAEDLDIPVTPKPTCVVKRLKPTEIDRDISRLFEQEAQILYQLGQNYDQIPKLYAYFQENQEFYLIQELIDGYDLTQEISPGKKLSEDDVIQLLRDILEILAYVHDNKVIHRDIKPANIMRRKDGKLVLIDFGIVKQINTNIALKSGFTSSSIINIGTWGYMPSEQAIGKPKLSSDIYALGMTAIQALIDLSPHLLPHDEDNDGEIVWSDQVQVSDKLEQFINKMVRYDWRQRYRDAKEALEELNQIFGIVKQQNMLPLTPTQSSKDWFEEGNKLLELKLYEEAIISYDKAIAINPDDDNAWHSRGVALGNLERYTESLTSFDKVIVINPDDDNAWYNRGFSLQKLQRYMEALESYNKAITIKPDSDHAWYGRGSTLNKLERYEEAIISFDKVIAIKPDNYFGWWSRSVSLFRLERHEEAIQSCEKAIDIKPDNQELINFMNSLKDFMDSIKNWNDLNDSLKQSQQLN
ncbi:protein kinase domain-containing protein [Anabaena catenula]|uniref:Tetratricopeptide repeat protein n=1 Tax=Anabaena catenula FACHB-362 TaxID=2692877 RepID=A0ABR8J8E2_9NOST|nr:serine/threonine-protein kinase [Anabaena catenula]MBD2693391.1 tetratricopeptide repeat protein [Anabaena catenula FACHB-362]